VVFGQRIPVERGWHKYAPGSPFWSRPIFKNSAASIMNPTTPSCKILPTPTTTPAGLLGGGWAVAVRFIWGREHLLYQPTVTYFLRAQWRNVPVWTWRTSAAWELRRIKNGLLQAHSLNARAAGRSGRRRRVHHPAFRRSRPSPHVPGFPLAVTGRKSFGLAPVREVLAISQPSGASADLALLPALNPPAGPQSVGPRLTGEPRWRSAGSRRP